MSGPIPTAVLEKMQPMSADFRPVILEDDDRIWWKGCVTTTIGNDVKQLQVEYGFSKRTGRDASELKAIAWQITELARLGRADLIGYARVDRHVGRAGVRPTITEANMGQGLGA